MDKLEAFWRTLYRFTGSIRAGFRNLAHSLGLYAGRALKGGGI